MLLFDNTLFLLVWATQVYEFDDDDLTGPKSPLVAFDGTNSPGSGPHGTGGKLRMFKVNYPLPHRQDIR